MMDQQLQVWAADWLAPMNGRVIRDGAVAGDGVIRAAGRRDDVIAQFPYAPVQRLGSVVLMPALINAHTHLELSDCQCGEKCEGRFIDWILKLPRRAAMDEPTRKQSIADATQHGIKQCLRFGVSCVGDISQYPQFSRRILRQLPLRSVSYAEVLGVGPRRARFEQLLAMVAAPASTPQVMGETPMLRAGLSPHAPYSVDWRGYVQCMELARQHQMPLATHLAEWPDEMDFLVDHAGMFRQLLDLLGSWRDDIETYPSSPIRFAKAIGLLEHPALLAHVNYCDDEELQMLAMGRASVVYCPRTHQYFSHPPHGWRKMLAAGVNVAVGTDSCASSPNLNVVDEIRLLHRIAPDVPAEDLWRLITVNAARAVGWDELGQLVPGRYADIVAFAVESDDPLTEILERSIEPTNLWIDGRPIRREK